MTCCFPAFSRMQMFDSGTGLLFFSAFSSVSYINCSSKLGKKKSEFLLNFLIF